MQATTIAPAAPATPQAITTTSADGKAIQIAIPQSETDVRALYARRRDVRDQLFSATNRRHSLVQEIRSAPEGVARTGLEQRITIIDQSIIAMERELNSITQQLDAAPAELISSTEWEPNRNYDSGFEDGVGAGIGGTTFALGALFLITWWRRRRKRKRMPVADPNDSPRLARLEQGMEAIAIEIERISEGQRFVTKLMSESREPVASRIAQPAQGSSGS